jgi:hypothetical protein
VAFCYRLGSACCGTRAWASKQQARRGSAIVIVITLLFFAFMVWQLFVSAAGTP